MRLLDTSSLVLKEFPDGHSIPSYAILSHTWGDHDTEVTFDDVKEANENKLDFQKKAGFQKLFRACEQARRDSLSHVWIDTCCIDKSSSIELSEAIKSMFRWYNEAAVCYTYLVDVTGCTKYRNRYGDYPLIASRDRDEYEGSNSWVTAEFKSSRWFTRGWTLQELLAPTRVVFFNRDWELVGERSELTGALTSATGISEEVLAHKVNVWDIDIATKMAWASKRQTTLPEDIAYSLSGIFNVNMPVLYGEGRDEAFARLLEHILRSYRASMKPVGSEFTHPSTPDVLSQRERFTCALCHRRFRTSKDLEKHAREQTHCTYRCQECNSNFTARRSLVRHMITHSHKKQHCCQHCGKRFFRKDHCVEHEACCFNTTSSDARSANTATLLPKPVFGGSDVQAKLIPFSATQQQQPDATEPRSEHVAASTNHESVGRQSICSAADVALRSNATCLVPKWDIKMANEAFSSSVHTTDIVVPMETTYHASVIEPHFDSDGAASTTTDSTTSLICGVNTEALDTVSHTQTMQMEPPNFVSALAISPGNDLPVLEGTSPFSDNSSPPLSISTADAWTPWASDGGLFPLWSPESVPQSEDVLDISHKHLHIWTKSHSQTVKARAIYRKPIPVTCTPSELRKPRKSIPRFYCEICESSFAREADLDRHINSAHGNEIFRCLSCNFAKSRKDKVLEHCRKRHNHTDFIVVWDSSAP